MAIYDDEIKRLEEEISKTPYNKRTQHHIGLLKAKIARLKGAQQIARGKQKKGEGYSVKKTGDSTAILIGFPSVGKSTLLNAITNAESKTAPYEFTTLTVIPGLLEYNNAKIQILDVPGVLKGASTGTGRGKEVLSVMRSADVCLFVIDVNHPEHLDVLKQEVYNSGIRLNEEPPNVLIKKRSRGGIDIGYTVKQTHLDKETIIGILKEFKIHNATVLIREDLTTDRLIDSIEANKVYMPSITIITKIDCATKEQIDKAVRETNADIAVSGITNQGIEELKKKIFEKLDLIRIYLKEPRKEADMKIPLVIKRGASIADVCNKIHKDFEKRFRFARVWGKSAKFPGQRFQLKHVLEDEDILEIHLR